MASTGNVLPGTGENVDRAGLTAWANPTRITADDGSDATCAAVSGGDYLVARNFGFSVPSTATILGVTFRVEASEHSPSTEDCFAQLQDSSASLIGSSKTANVSGTTKVVYTYGGSADLWGATLTPAIVNDANFGVRFWFETSHDVRVDFVTVAIEYDTTQNLQPTLVTNSQTFYAPTVTPGAVTITPSLFTNSQTFYAPNVTQPGGTQDLTPSLVTNSQTFYAPTVAATYALTPDLFTNTQTFYAPTVTGTAAATTAQTGQTPAGRPRRWQVETTDGDVREFTTAQDAQDYLQSIQRDEPEEEQPKPKKRRRKRKQASDYAPQREVETIRLDGLDLRGVEIPGMEALDAFLREQAHLSAYVQALEAVMSERDDEQALLRLMEEEMKAFSNVLMKNKVTFKRVFTYLFQKTTAQG